MWSDDRTEGECRIRRGGEPRRPSAWLHSISATSREPTRTAASTSVDVWANRKLESALQPRLPVMPINPAPVRRRPLDPITLQPPTPPPLNPLARLETLATDIASALDFMAAKFGPPALPHLAVSPIPGTFGQGFPGLIYLSTLAYLRNVSSGLAMSRNRRSFLRRRHRGSRNRAPMVGQPSDRG